MLIEGLFLLVFWAWSLSALLFLRNTILPKTPLLLTLELAGLSGETVRFEATDGHPLEGWIIAGDAARPWILLCHGLGSNRANILTIARGLHAAGFNLFLFDFRAHGGSPGLVTSFGWREQRDLEGAVAYLSGQPDLPARPYGVYGISMGGAVALMVAARDDRVGAVAADGIYADLETSIAHHLKLMYPWVPRVPFLWCVASAYRLRFGVWPAEVSPEKAARRLGGRRLLLIQGAADPRATVAEAQRIAGAAGAAGTFVVAPGAGHLEGFAVDPEGYLGGLVGFFEEALETPSKD